VAFEQFLQTGAFLMVHASNPSELVSFNPATLEPVGKVPVSSPEDVHACVARAGKAFPAWRDLGTPARSRVLHRAQQILIERGEAMGRLITLEMGRPFVESMTTEVEASVDLLGYYAGKSKRFMRPRRIPLHNAFFLRRKSVVVPQPLGVLGVIAPWNWPLLIPLGCIIPALAAGNTVVFKPSELTPLTGQAMAELLRDAGVPDDVFRVVQGRGDTGQALVDSPVEKIFFTGSTEVGRHIMRQAAPALGKVVLEMGGSDPALVCGDADIDFASSGVLWGAMNNCGQNCNSVERVFVHRSVLNAFLERLVEKTGRLRTGDGMDLGTDVGPLASEGQRRKIERIVQKSLSEKGRILCGGRSIQPLPGHFFEPTVLFHETLPAFLPEEEIFGPLLIVVPVKDDDEAVSLANRSMFGLAASVWTGNSKHGEALAARLESGSVMVNDVVVSFGISEAGWTGIKKSGVGWVHGEKGMDEMVNLKYLNRDPQNRIQKFWWFPYGSGMADGIKAGIVFLYGAGWRRKLSVLPKILRFFSGYLLLNRRRGDKL
jgi:acyl-CoA reductase-like NAD-dependent aldehyde dehydrogenase